MSVHDQARAAAQASHDAVYDDAIAAARAEGRDLGYDDGFTAGERSRDAEVTELRTDLGLALVERDRVRAAYDAHMATHSPEPEPEPQRMRFGAAFGSNSDPAPIERHLGGPLQVRRTYYGANEVTKAINTCLADKTAGRRPMISFKLPTTWAQAASGAADAWATNLRDRLAELDMDIDLYLHHEPEGDEPPAAWLPMQARLIPLVKSDRVRVGACFTGWDQLENGTWSWAVSWPQQAEFIGVDIYQQYGRDSHTGLKQVTGWSPLEVRFGKVKAFADSVGVPWGLAETGVSTIAHAARPSEVARLFKAAEDAGAEFLCWFDSNLNSSTDWTLVSAPKEPTDMSARVAKAEAVRAEVQRLRGA